MGLVPAGFVKSLVNKYLTDGSVTVDVTYKKNSGTYSKTTAVKTLTSTSYSMKALTAVEYKQEDSDENSTKKVQFKRFFIRAQYFEDEDITPTQSDYIYYDSVNWEVLTIEPIRCGGTDLMYEFYCKRG